MFDAVNNICNRFLLTQVSGKVQFQSIQVSEILYVGLGLDIGQDICVGCTYL